MNSCRIIGALLLACFCWVGSAVAGEAGRETLRNGAVLSWQVEDAGDPRLGLAVPAFAQWGSQGFADPVTIRMSATTLAFIDAWQLSFYRIGDARFERPLRRFRGTALTLHDPLSWDGNVETGAPLRPGETVLAVLETRDTAGNIDRADPQEMMVARYIMKRERRRIRDVDARRKADVVRGSAIASRAMPSTGRAVSLRIDGWPEDDPPLLSGIPLHRDGSSWTLRQTVPGGAYDLVVQVARPIIGGTRAIPVGIARLLVPTGAPLMARVKGTGALDREDRQGMVPEGLRDDGAIDGDAATRLVLLDRQVGEDRLAFASMDPVGTVDLAKNRRKRRFLVVPADSSVAQWAGQGASSSTLRPTAEARTRTISVVFDSPIGSELILPHTDIVWGSLRIQPQGDASPLSPVRDFFANPAQGRILLTESAINDFGGEQVEGLRVEYSVNTFAPRLQNEGRITDNGKSSHITWDANATRKYSEAKNGTKEKGFISKVLSWFSGSD